MGSAPTLVLITAGLLGLVWLAYLVRTAGLEASTLALMLASGLAAAAGLVARGRLVLPGALLTVGAVTVVARETFALTPTVVWMFAFIVPVVGLVHGARLGMIAGAVSAPALHWIETGVPFDPVDPQTPFGILILVALGATPGYLLDVARNRRAALDRQLERAEGLVRATETAREAEADARHQAIFMLARAAEARDGTTGTHIEHVRDLAAELAAACGLSGTDLQELSWAAMLHDVGKLRVPDRVLLKPGRLDDEEWGLIRQHPEWGEQLLMGDESFALARVIARSHHENWDGSGYPDRLARARIPLPARIVRVVDVYDALRSERPYKPAWSIERVLDELRAMRGTALDPDLVDQFVALRDR